MLDRFIEYGIGVTRFSMAVQQAFANVYRNVGPHLVSLLGLGDVTFGRIFEILIATEGSWPSIYSRNAAPKSSCLPLIDSCIRLSSEFFRVI